MTLPVTQGTYQTLLEERAERSGETLRIAYPSDLLVKKNHFCEISALNHMDTSDTLLSVVGSDRNNQGVQTGRHAVASIYLPIPEQFTQGTLEQKFDNEASIVKDLLGSDLNSDDTGRIITSGLALSQTIPNQGFYVKYERPMFREYEFAWILSPHNQAESNIIQNLTRWLKFYSSPAKKGAFDNGADGMAFLQGLTLSYPNEFRVRFVYTPDGATAQDIFLPRPQTGYITQLDISHFDEGGDVTGFFKGTKHPIITTIKMTYQENRLMYKNDFAGIPIYDEMDAQVLDVGLEGNPSDPANQSNGTVGGGIRGGVTDFIDGVNNFADGIADGGDDD